MPKTFYPTMVRRLQALNVYAAKHAQTLAGTLTTAQSASLARIQTEITTYFNANVKETP